MPHSMLSIQAPHKVRGQHSDKKKPSNTEIENFIYYADDAKNPNETQEAMNLQLHPKSFLQQPAGKRNASKDRGENVRQTMSF